MKTTVIKDLILLLIVLGLAFSGWQIWNHSAQAAKIENVQLEQESLEESALLQEIRKMEQSIAARRNYALNLQSDPMDLSEYVKDSQAEKMEKVLAMRLTATILGDKPTAILFWQGKNYRVAEGGTLDGYRVLRIVKNQAVIRKPGGGTMTLVTQPEPDLSETQKELNDRGKKYDQY